MNVYFTFQRFDKIDDRFGKKLVSIVIGYLVSGYHGISESELLDLLSCNNDALLLSYSRDMPCVLRFPTVLWQEMYQYLGEDKVFNKQLTSKQLQ